MKPIIDTHIDRTIDHLCLPLFLKLANELNEAGIPYCYESSSALIIHGIPMPEIETLDIAVQWDYLPQTRNLFQFYQPQNTLEKSGLNRLAFIRDDIRVLISFHKNQVLEADPDRIEVICAGQPVWTKSLSSYRKQATESDPFLTRIEHYLQEMQSEHSHINKAAWNVSPYEAWISRFGTPAEAAARIMKDPSARLSSLSPYLGNLDGKKAINLLGSHGSKAVAMALLGANVTIVDISEENARYAEQLASESDVSIRYIVSDVLKLPIEELNSSYDLVLMEFGILHYFTDLQPLMEVIFQLLRHGGRLLLQDFHPVSTKMIASRGKKHKVTGDYFNESLEESEVAYAKFLPESEKAKLKKVRLRKWTMGEIVSSVAEAGLNIRLLHEEPNQKPDDKGIPKIFTLIAEKR